MVWYNLVTWESKLGDFEGSKGEWLQVVLKGKKDIWSPIFRSTLWSWEGGFKQAVGEAVISGDSQISVRTWR